MSSSDYRLIRGTTTIHLNNSTGEPVAGGNLSAPNTTPLKILDRWVLAAPAPDAITANADATLLSQTYGPMVEDTIPLIVVASSTNNLLAIERALRQQFRGRGDQPCVLYAQPAGASSPVYFVVTHATVQLGTPDNSAGPAEGALVVLITLTLTRSALGGTSSLITVASGATITNQGTGANPNLISLGNILGDLAYEGQPLNIQLTKPTSQSAHTLLLASVASSTFESINAAVTTSSTTGTTFTAGSSISMAALRTTPQLKLHIVARVKTLTNPANAQIQARVLTPGSAATLWTGPWVTLGSNTTAQLVDLSETGLDMLRVPISGTPNIIIQIAIRSTSGSVTVTLDYVEALLAYDVCQVDSGGAGLGAGQRYELCGAQNLAGGPYLPLVPESALICDSSGNPLKTARILGTLPRAYVGASLYAAWIDTNGAQTATDTATISIAHAPLYVSPRGLG